jgi:hypothetical protein
MAVQHADGPSLIDVLDRVLDKGIIIDAWTRVSLVGIDMITIESRVMVASFDTYLNYSEPLRYLPSISSPVGRTGSFENTKPPPHPSADRASRRRK